MAFLESQEKMPAHPWEVEAALAEGIRLYPSCTFERIEGNDQSHVSGVECMQVSSFTFDETGRLKVEKIPGSEHTITCDTVIFSVGQRAGLAFIPDDAGVGLTTRNTIAVNPNTFAATRPGVFAAGDSVSGTAFVIEAVDSGHKAAQTIIRYLLGEQLEPPAKPELPVVHLEKDEIDERIRRGEIKLQARIPLPELPVEQRIANFSEVESGYDDQSAQAEAARCLACGICSECMSCVFACGVNAIDHDMPGKQVEIQAGAIILAKTNMTEFTELYTPYHHIFGSALSGIGHLLSGGLKTVYISAHLTYKNLIEAGSHALVDPLWSSESLQVIHEGEAATRLEKVRLLAQDEVALQTLRVCWRNVGEVYNCGTCEKCLRTMVALQAVGALERCKTFDRPIDIKQLKRQRYLDDSTVCFHKENLDALRQQPWNQALFKAERRVIAFHHYKTYLARIRDLYPEFRFGFGRLFKKFRKKKRYWEYNISVNKATPRFK